MAIDARGFPVRIVPPDPRAYVVHKHWLSERPDRNTLKRDRDAAQARWVAALAATHMSNLPFDPEVLKSFPKSVVERAKPLFEVPGSAEASFTMYSFQQSSRIFACIAEMELNQLLIQQ